MERGRNLGGVLDKKSRDKRARLWPSFEVNCGSIFVEGKRT